MFAEMDAGGWVLVITAAIGAIGTVILQIVQMILSYLRDKGVKADVCAVKADTSTVVKATNGMTEKLVAAELVAERIVVKAEAKAASLIDTASRAASDLVSNTAKQSPNLQPTKENNHDQGNRDRSSPG